MLRRKAWHLLAGSGLATVTLTLPRPGLLALLGTLLAVFLLGEGLRFLFPGLNRFLFRHLSFMIKKEETSRLLGSTYLVAASLIIFLVLPRDVAAAALYLHSLGDVVAYLVGKRWGRHRYRGKSLEGSLGYFAAATAVGLALGLGVLDLSAGKVLVGAGVGMAIEFLALPPDDNFTCPIFSGVAMGLL